MLPAAPFRPTTPGWRRDGPAAATDETNGTPPPVADGIACTLAAVAIIGFNGDSEDGGSVDDDDDDDDGGGGSSEGSEE